MKKELIIIGLLLSIALIAGCAPKQIVGGDRDAHGCIPSAGYSWCEQRQECIRPWEINCTKECGECPMLSPPGPDFCKQGTIVQGEKNDCGCQGPPKCVMACTEEAKICPDGTAVARNGSNNCEFDACPEQLVGNDRDDYGCIGSAGYSWNSTIGACIREWELNEAQRKAAKLVVAHLSYYVTVTEVEVLRCLGCFIVHLQRNDNQERSVYEMINWIIKNDSTNIYCTEEQKNAQICTMEYMPVCGDDGVTYGNKCGACASKNIDSYTPGECPDKCAGVYKEVSCADRIKPVEYTDDNGCIVSTCPNYCKPEQRNADVCPTLYAPVCGWFNQSIQCIKYPCAATYANYCSACLDLKVDYYTEGECPD